MAAELGAFLWWLGHSCVQHVLPTPKQRFVAPVLLSLIDLQMPGPVGSEQRASWNNGKGYM